MARPCLALVNDDHVQCVGLFQNACQNPNRACIRRGVMNVACKGSRVAQRASRAVEGSPRGMGLAVDDLRCLIGACVIPSLGGLGRPCGARGHI